MRVLRNPRSVISPDLPKAQESTPLVESVLNKGMVSTIDPADIDNAALSLARNARFRRDKCSRRPGKSVFGAARPNSNLIKALIEYKTGDSLYYVRVTDSGAHYSDGSAAWVALSGSLNSGIQDRIRYAIILNSLILANGIDKLQKVDVSAGTIADLGDIAPRAPYVTGISDRVVAAKNDQVYWSGNRNIDEFDAVQDISAGNKQLGTSASGLYDPITGLFGLTSLLIIPRERSIWLATPQPIASNPFNFYSAVPGIGFDVPNAIALTKSGLIGLSLLSGNIYRYVPGNAPEEIGTAVIDDIINNVTDQSLISSTYDGEKREFILEITPSVIPVGENNRRLWIYNELTGAWGRDDQPNITTISVVGSLTDYTSIDELTGTIDALAGTIDNLSVSPVVKSLLITGDSAGNLLREDTSVDQDNLVDYTFEIRSKEFVSPRVDLLVNELRFEYQATIAGDIVLQYSKNGGNSWVIAKTTATVVGDKRLIQFKRLIRTRRIMWRLTATDGIFDILNYEVHIYASGDSKAP